MGKNKERVNCIILVEYYISKESLQTIKKMARASNTIQTEKLNIKDNSKMTYIMETGQFIGETEIILLDFLKMVWQLKMVLYIHKITKLNTMDKFQIHIETDKENIIGPMDPVTLENG
jgi:hypothetical protein